MGHHPNPSLPVAYAKVTMGSVAEAAAVAAALHNVAVPQLSGGQELKVRCVRRFLPPASVYCVRRIVQPDAPICTHLRPVGTRAAPATRLLQPGGMRHLQIQGADRRPCRLVLQVHFARVAAAAVPQSPRSPLSPRGRLPPDSHCITAGAGAGANGKPAARPSNSSGPSLGPPAGPQRCGSCGKAESAVLALRRCSACKCVAYCCTPCQHADWQARHSGECAALQQLGGLLAGNGSVAGMLQAAMARPRSGLGRAVQALLAARLAALEEQQQQQEGVQQPAQQAEQVQGGEAEQEEEAVAAGEVQEPQAAHSEEGRGARQPEAQPEAAEVQQPQAAEPAGAPLRPAAGREAQAAEGDGQAARKLVAAAFSAALARQAPAPLRGASAAGGGQEAAVGDAQAARQLMEAAIQAVVGAEQAEAEARL